MLWHLLFPCGGKLSAAPLVYRLSPEEGVGFSPEAVGTEERPGKLKWLFVSMSGRGEEAQGYTLPGHPVGQGGGPHPHGRLCPTPCARAWAQPLPRASGAVPRRTGLG